MPDFAGGDGGWSPFHLHYFTRRTIVRLLERHGFRVREIRSVGYYRSLDAILHRLLVLNKGKVYRAIYEFARRSGITNCSVYLNLYDIMLIIAEAGEPVHI